MSNTKTAKRRRKWKLKLAAGCLALGMATAWGGQSQASTVVTSSGPYFNITMNTTQTIHDAFLCYVCNVSSPVFQSLGTLPQGPSTLSVAMNYSGYMPEYGIAPYYGLLGLYGQGNSEGVVFAFPSSAGITPGTTWASIFQTGSYYDESEADVIAMIHGTATDQPVVGYDFGGFVLYASDYWLAYGEQADLIGFSDATPLGTLNTVIGDAPLPPPQPTAVPEPASWVLLVGMAGVALVGRRKLLGQ